jgi:2-isopropylmalate synthase
MVRETISFFKGKGKEVVFDAEHFFDGYRADPDYAMQCLRVAEEAGADWLVLCDTNGGALPWDVENIVKEAVRQFTVPIGIHCHNDGGMAVANSVVAVLNGALQVQGTVNGYGERCGNANLCTVIPNLQLKCGFPCIPDEQMENLSAVSRYVSELANQVPDEREPYVGRCAFAHKGGMHIDAILKDPLSFEHISPHTVGNERRILMSEVSGRSTILKRIQEVTPWVCKESKETQYLMEELKKIFRIIGRELPGADVETLLVLDATTGQNAVSQAKTFSEVSELSGLVLTKLDGTAKGGVIVSIKSELNIPVKFIGVGEQMNDMQPFNPTDFVEALFGTEA